MTTTREGTLSLKVISAGPGKEDQDEVRFQISDPVDRKAGVAVVKRHEFSRQLAKPGTVIKAKVTFMPLLVDLTRKG